MESSSVNVLIRFQALRVKVIVATGIVNLENVLSMHPPRCQVVNAGMAMQATVAKIQALSAGTIIATTLASAHQCRATEMLLQSATAVPCLEEQDANIVASLTVCMEGFACLMARLVNVNNPGQGRHVLYTRVRGGVSMAQHATCLKSVVTLLNAMAIGNLYVIAQWAS
jgi:hypothetical protein